MTTTTPQQVKTEGLDVIACPACGSDRARVVITSPDRQIGAPGTFYASRCSQCGLLFQNPRIAPERLAAHYPAEYAPYHFEDIKLSVPGLWRLKSKQRYAHLDVSLAPTRQQRNLGRWIGVTQLIPDFTPGGKLIEIGCAGGQRLALMRDLGWENPVGYEYSDSAASTARARGFEVVTGPIETNIDQVPDGSIDAIIAGFVIEHVLDPYELVRKLTMKLKPGGQLMFCTINIGSLDFWLYGTHWLDLDLPRHMVFFRKRDLKTMLGDGFEIEKTYTIVNSNGFYGSARYRRVDKVGGFRGWLDARLLGTFPNLPRPLYALPRVGMGGRIFVSARKK